MKGRKWIKLVIDVFDNRKIKYLRTLPNGNLFALFWIMLLTAAGRCDSNGFIYFAKDIPYTDKMLADEFGFDEETVKTALAAFQRCKMLEKRDGMLFITGWQEYQNSVGFEARDSFTDTKKYSYGSHNNIMLTLAEYNSLKKYKFRDKLIDEFSQRIFQKGDTYYRHYSVLDKIAREEGQRFADAENKPSFNIDEFFDLAVERGKSIVSHNGR